MDEVPRVRTLARNAFFPFEILGLTGVKENAIRSPDPSREVDILTFRFRTIDLFSRKNGLNKVVMSTFRLASMTNRQCLDRQWKVVI